MKKILLVSLFSFPTALFAVMAYPGEITFKQADGLTFKGHLKGDEWFSWIEGKQGEVIAYNRSSKNYELAIIKQINDTTELMPSGVKFSPSHIPKSGSPTINVDSIKDSLSTIWRRKRNKALEQMNNANQEIGGAN